MSADNECPFEAGEEYTTRNGSRARVYCTDAGAPYTIHGAILHEEGSTWKTRTWKADGSYTDHTGDPWDLVPPGQRSHFWYDSEVRGADAKISAFWKHPLVVVQFVTDTDRVRFDQKDLEHLLAMLPSAREGAE